MENIISLSSAGGGKTTRLIERINSVSGRMLVISFTKASCKDILKRINNPQISVMTLHSFANSLIGSNFHVVESSFIFVEMFIGRYFQLRNLGISTVVSLVENYFIFENFCDDLSFLSLEDKQLNLDLQSLIADIKIEKSKHSIVFFSDLINIAAKNFSQYESKINYDHLLVDEAQDLSMVQLNLLYKMIDKIFTKNDKSFFIVGDKKQSIYSFQGSSEKFYTDFIQDIERLCIEKNRPLKFESQNVTYRFGGEILQRVNQLFEGHKSSVNHGELFEKYLSEKEAVDFITKFVTSYSGPPEDIMILYERTTQFIVKLQETLQEFGMHCKIYLQNSKLVEALYDIVSFQQTGAEYYRAKILQGPFVHCSEPEFYEMAMTRNWPHPSLFDFLSQDKSAFEVLSYLNNLHLSSTDFLIFQELLKGSRQYMSLEEMMFSIGDTILVKKEGVQFSTIHSAKGLESKIVFYIKQKSGRPKIQTSLSPFFFCTEKKEAPVEEKNNLEYVALSRAKEKLYILDCSSSIE
jgi:superfamily I DNA/RNA helicase